MKALVHRGPRRLTWEDVPDPRTFTDDVPGMAPGRARGKAVDGTHAKYARVPFADASTEPPRTGGTGVPKVVATR
ncbi:hypothetical protein GCM10022243_54210 [Saccharothrix violaceirubra]|uniref:Uncharacterized protein n=1 Tax=Saccharothrix violaceirubra TaxID=413306 RepID=A0A7W7WXR9_9PSEU|nr:hypothetical protein [Saccharothrix violaceirubra]MBB4966933.1 hypothetical protein [Saccharothrix violaceirubra]